LFYGSVIFDQQNARHMYHQVQIDALNVTSTEHMFKKQVTFSRD
jgi:hypothetical protein